MEFKATETVLNKPKQLEDLSSNPQIPTNNTEIEPKLSNCPPIMPSVQEETLKELIEESIILPSSSNQGQEKVLLTNIDMSEVLDLTVSENLVLKEEHNSKFTDSDYGNWILDGKAIVENSMYNVYNGTGDYSTIKILIVDNIDHNPII